MKKLNQETEVKMQLEFETKIDKNKFTHAHLFTWLICIFAVLSFLANSTLLKEK